MFGNRMNSAQIRNAIESNAIELEPFDSALLKLSTYSLHPGAILIADVRNTDLPPHVDFDYACDGDTYSISPGGFVTVEIEEFVFVSPGIEGDFVTAGTMIEKGLLVLHGRFEHPFGKFDAKRPDAMGNGPRQKIRLGLKNLTDAPVELHASDEVAHVRFTDFRGLCSEDSRPSEVDARRIMRRTSTRALRAMDDGPIYDE